MGLWRARAQFVPDSATVTAAACCARVQPAACASTPRVGVKRVACASTSGQATPEPQQKRVRRSGSQTRREDQALHDLIGPATESAEAHRCRHSPPNKSCPRCRFYKMGASWVGAYGTVHGFRHGPDRTIWVAERPARWGGPWALGCTICSQALIKASEVGASTPKPCELDRRRRVRGGTAWARFEARGRHMMSECIRTHARSEEHRRAVAAHVAPNTPMRLLLQVDIEDDLLLRGAVPQPCDWLRAWRSVRNPSSWQATAERAQTEHFIAQIYDRSAGPKAFKSMVICMGEVLRRLKRKCLWCQATIFV